MGVHSTNLWENNSKMALKKKKAPNSLRKRNPLHKKHKNRKAKIPKINLSNWNTSDVDEIERRKARAQLEKFHIENTESTYPYFSTFLVSSKNDKKYCVEIRSLIDFNNSCDCPDHRSNKLGTCKHVEHVLILLNKMGVKRYKEAAVAGSKRVEIFLDLRRELAICVSWPKGIADNIKNALAPFFSNDGSLIGDPAISFSNLTKTISDNIKLKNQIRLSRHIPYFIEYQQINSQKEQAKEFFLQDVQEGKRTLNVVKCPLFPYQQEGALHLAFTERALLADEMGLGKTVQAIVACELLRHLRNIKRVLIVTTASLKAEWEEQIAKFADLTTHIIVGVRAQRLKQYKKNAFFYLMNYEQIISDHAEIQRLLAPDVIILDEAQRIKNWQTKTANAVKELKSRYAFVLTGTPVENRIDDIYSIIQFLDPHIFGPLFRFNRDFYQLDLDGRPIGYKNLDELYRRLRPIMLCRRKTDVEEELPPRLNNNYFISMAPEQRSRYEEYENMVSRLLSQAEHRSLLKEEFELLQQWLACMRMICDTPYILDKDCRISPKLQELRLILEELLTDEDNKIIIFSEWERMLYLVKEMAEEYDLDIAWHTGSVPQQKRRENIKRFKDNKNCRLFLSTDAGSVGLNLQVANIVINLDLPWNPARLEQRIARAWRKHQKRSVQVINLICEESIEHRMLFLLEKKQLLANNIIVGGDLKEMKIPSGRTAFIERMNELMSHKRDQVSHKKNQNENNTNEIKIRDFILEQTDSNLDILHSYQNQTNQTKTLFAVCGDNSQDLQQKIHHLQDNSQKIEMIDRNTFETIQRLVEAGILSFNKPSSVLHEATDESKRLIHKKQIETAKKYLSDAERKQKMAHLLINGGFSEESIDPLKEAIQLTLQAFLQLVNDQEHQKLKTLSLQFVKDKLVENYGMPDKIIPLFSQLNETSTELKNIPSLHDDYQEVVHHVHNILNKKEALCGEECVTHIE